VIKRSKSRRSITDGENAEECLLSPVNYEAKTPELRRETGVTAWKAGTLPLSYSRDCSYA
jgi:hypothetical protein